jgi:D-beta-D-heptose 7-phosphate kinase/D-beta-D-heptose 1-phosphate adenosyltransferase
MRRYDSFVMHPPDSAGGEAGVPRGADPPEDPELIAAVRRLSRASVLVVGDAMLDRYIYGEVDRVSPEAPVPVLVVQRELAMPGGAGNVVRNLGALDVAVAFVSVVGDDQAGSDLTGLIGGQPGVEPWLLVQGGRATTVKTRLVAQGQQLVRVDREDTTPIQAKLAERLLRIARDAMAATSLTILSDYRKGVLASDVAVKLVAAARQAGRPVLVDARGGDFAPYAGADVVLPTRRDLALATGMPTDDDASIALAAASLRALHDFGAVLVSRAEDGMTLVHDGGVQHFRRQVAEAFDTSGAGDSGVATLGAALAAGVKLPVAARLANIAAGIAMGRMGTAVVREQDLVTALSPDSGVLRKVVARDVAAGHMERWRRRGWRTGFAHGCFDSLRPGHIHMLQQARAVCDRLVVAITGDALAPARADGRPAQPEMARASRLAALPGVDLVLIADEDGPTPLLQLLRPDVLITGADAQRDGGEADLLSQWGGRVVRAERLPEPT